MSVQNSVPYRELLFGQQLASLTCISCRVHCFELGECYIYVVGSKSAKEMMEWHGIGELVPDEIYE